MLSLLGWVLTTVPKGGFEEALAVQDTWLNQLMGCSSGIANWTCGLPCVKVPTLAREQASDVKRDTLALSVRMSASECAVIFRGTKNVYNVLEDLSFFPQAVPGCDGCKVHSGFADDWKGLEPQVTAQLSKLGCANGTVSVLGHSLGAAMAAIATYDLAGSWPIGRVYTYGQPRVGNDHFAAAFDARLARLRVTHYRVVDYRDAVPHLPLQNMLWEGWSHTGQEVYYAATKLGAYTVCALANDTKCSAQWDIFQTLTHTCDHCSYLGMNPCGCGATKPACTEPHAV